MFVISIAGCDTSQSHELMQKVQDQHGDIYIDDYEVQVTDEHLASIKPKLYQPSLTLSGQLKPLQKTIIVSPERAHIKQLLVYTGMHVQKNDTLFSYTTPPIEVTVEIKPTHLVDNVTHMIEEPKQPETELSLKQNKKLESSLINNKNLEDSIQVKASPEVHNEKASTEATVAPKKDNHAESNQLSTTHITISDGEKKIATSNEKKVEKSTKGDTKNPKVAAAITFGEEKTISAPFTGTISEIYYSHLRDASDYLDLTIVKKNTPLMKLETSNNLHFVSVLPIYTQSKLSIGQHVNFVAQQVTNKTIDSNDHEIYNTPSYKKNEASIVTNDLKLTGQISDIHAINDDEIQVDVNLLLDEQRSRSVTVTDGLFVQGKVNYGQMEVGTVVDASGVFQTAKSDLSLFKLPEAHVSAPIEAYVWIVGHDKRVRRLPVYAVSYDINTKQYLVSDVPSEVMIILADLPESAKGKKLKIY